VSKTLKRELQEIVAQRIAPRLTIGGATIFRRTKAPIRSLSRFC